MFLSGEGSLSKTCPGERPFGLEDAAILTPTGKGRKRLSKKDFPYAMTLKETGGHEDRTKNGLASERIIYLAKKINLRLNVCSEELHGWRFEDFGAVFDERY
ncbi:MAG: hypothetical protein LBJ64_09495 [Deltaproteobacteria bacterium]|nr:hypothetical protein [Deltaproteobacteria bacterium]